MVSKCKLRHCMMDAGVSVQYELMSDAAHLPMVGLGAFGENDHKVVHPYG